MFQFKIDVYFNTFHVHQVATMYSKRLLTKLTQQDLITTLVGLILQYILPIELKFRSKDFFF